MCVCVCMYVLIYVLSMHYIEWIPYWPWEQRLVKGIISKAVSIFHFYNFCILFKIYLSAEADIRIDSFVLQGICFAFFV